MLVDHKLVPLTLQLTLFGKELYFETWMVLQRVWDSVAIGLVLLKADVFVKVGVPQFQ